MTDADEFKDQYQKGRRTDAAAEEMSTLREDIVAELKEIDGGKRKTLAIRDESLAALFNALDEHDEEMASVLEDLGDAAGRDASDHTKSELLRLAARVGLQTAAEDTWDELLEAKKERAVDSA
jgi:elongation factor P--beta-lysine ligase